MVKLTQIGDHIFYRWPGGLGAPAAFQGQYAGAETPHPLIKGFDTGLAPVKIATLESKVAPPVTAAVVTPNPRYRSPC